MKLALVAEPAAASIAGLVEPEPDGADVVVALGDLPAPDAGVVLRWSADCRLASDDGRLVWRAPWPAADELFERGRADPDGRAGVLVTGDRRDDLLERLEERGVAAVEREALDADALLAAGCVIFGGEPGVPLPATAPAVLAAGCVLILPRAEPAFGLLPGIDHLAYDEPEFAVRYAETFVAHPRAFELIRAMGRVHAEAHRASAVYARLLGDLELGAPA